MSRCRWSSPAGERQSPYVNIIAVRDQDQDKPWVAQPVKAYQSEEVKKFIQAEFTGAVLPGF